MNELVIKHKYKVGQIVYFMRKNEIRKGIVDRVEINAKSSWDETGGMVEKIAKKIIFFVKDYPFGITITYNMSMVHRDNSYASCPHIRRECEVYESQKDLIHDIFLK